MFVSIALPALTSLAFSSKCTVTFMKCCRRKPIAPIGSPLRYLENRDIAILEIAISNETRHDGVVSSRIVFALTIAFYFDRYYKTGCLTRERSSRECFVKYRKFACVRACLCVRIITHQHRVQSLLHIASPFQYRRFCVPGTDRDPLRLFHAVTFSKRATDLRSRRHRYALFYNSR